MQPDNRLVNLQYENQNKIWLLSIDNPPVNSLTNKLLDQLGEAINTFIKDPAAQILLLTGSGRMFSAGANIDEIMAIKTAEEGACLAKRGQQLCDKIENSDKPIFAIINGLCIGGGNEIAMACHFRIGSERAKFGQPEVNIGIIPGFGGTQRLTRLIGAAQARRLILTGDLISADEASSLGLVDMVVATDKLMTSAMSLAGKIIRNSQVCVLQAQKAIREGLNLSLQDALKNEVECFKMVCRSSDMKEGLSAYKEKRHANYTGH